MNSFGLFAVRAWAAFALVSPAAARADDVARFYGMWEQLGWDCVSSKAGMEGYYFEFGPGIFIPGGGTCENVGMTVDGDRLTVTATCNSEESGPAPIRSVFQMSGPFLIDQHGQKLERCSQ